MASIVRVVLGLVALTIAGVSFTMNATFWAELYKGDPFKVKLWIGFSVVAGVLKFGIPLYFVVYRKRWRSDVMLVVLWFVAFTFDNVSGLGFTTHGRDEIALAAEKADGKRSKLETDRNDLAAALAKIPKETRQAAPVKTEMDHAAAEAGKCDVSWRAKLDPCQKLFRLQTEHANALERDRLAAALKPIATALADTPKARPPEPHLEALKQGVGVFMEISLATANKIWVVLYLLIVELCPAPLLAAVIRAPPAAPLVLERPEREPGRQRPAGPARASTDAQPGPKRTPAPGAADVLDLLRNAVPDPDGWITTTQRAMAKAIGVSVAEVNRQIADLEARGVVAKAAGRRGTRLKLLSAPLSVVSGHRRP